MAQQRLGRQCYQRLAQRANRLTTQHVVDLCRRGRYADLDVVLGAQLQVALQTRGRVLRPLPFIAVRQQHGQTAQTAPLVLPAGDELVDHDLGAVGEITELRFPDHQRIRRSCGIAVFERENRFLGKEGVVQIETWLTFVQVLQRDIGAAILLVVQRSMTMREGTATDVLTGDTHRMAFKQQRRVSHGLGIAPVNGQRAGAHLLAIFEDFRNLALHHEAFRRLQQLVGEILQSLQVEAGVVTRGPGMTQIGAPVDEQFLVRLLDQALDHMQTVVQRSPILVDFCLDALIVEHLGLNQRIGVQLTGGALLGDLLVHQRLGTAWFVRFVVTTTTVADQVDDDVTLELHAIVDGKLGDEQHCLGIVCVHVEDRRLDHLRHVSRILGGTSIFLLVGGEADLVVDHDADGATGAVGTGLRHLEGFHHHTLTGDSCVTVDGDWQNLVANRVVAAVLTSAYRTLDHRRDDLQVRRVERHGEVDLTTWGHHVGREALVILDVTGAQAFDLLAFELVEQIARILAKGVDQYVQTTAVGHTDDDFLGAVGAGALDDLIEQRDQTLATFQTEALGAWIFGTQILFQTFGSGEAL